ncbi:MAG: cytochrome d ubiquinol oxidase subunit II [Muribaculaceae bacterium]|nr:cytochrome d ubiquinol oxidase subunit II [Muribaculaceae bacterium]
MQALQTYWWFLISLLGALLVFLLFVQGGQTLLFCSQSDMTRNLKVNSLGRKWELTYTTLVVFGGAFFASFPLFYSTCFGGAYWLWMLILLSFILQAVSYEFRRKPGNLFGTRVYDAFLFFNGCVGCILLGVAVGMMIFGADFTITKGNILDGSSPVISVWNDSHGLEAIFNWRNLLVGLTVLFLARTNAALYFLNNIEEGTEFRSRQRKAALINGGVFVVLFLVLVAVIFTSKGYAYDENGVITEVPFKYADNLMTLWWLGVVFLLGVVMVLYGLGKTALRNVYARGIWWTGAGTVLAILALLCLIGYNATAYLPSISDPQSSLTIANSSSTEFTLKVMTWVSILSPIVIAYIFVVWRKLSSPPLTPTELEHDHESY